MISPLVSPIKFCKKVGEVDPLLCRLINLDVL
jgi:hypothetical protein